MHCALNGSDQQTEWQTLQCHNTIKLCVERIKRIWFQCYLNEVRTIIVSFFRISDKLPTNYRNNTMALGSTQPLTEMSTRKIPGE
jgi:hypothetical protein